MLFHEFSLVLFTLLSQMAAGIVFTGECLLHSTNNADIRLRIRRQNIVALVLLGVAALLSLAHLGSPLNAFNTIRNLGSSWLSREIITLGLFGAALLWLAYKRLKKEEQPAEGLAGLLAAIMGLVLVAVTSQVYSTPMLPTWHAPSLPAFFGSALVLGAGWNTFAMCRGLSAAGRDTAVPGAPLLLIAVLGMILVAISLSRAVPVRDLAMNANSILVSAAYLGNLAVWHALLSGIGILFLGAAILRWPFASSRACLVSAAALPLLLAGEFLGRAGFYLAYARLGM